MNSVVSPFRRIVLLVLGLVILPAIADAASPDSITASACAAADQVSIDVSRLPLLFTASPAEGAKAAPYRGTTFGSATVRVDAGGWSLDLGAVRHRPAATAGIRFVGARTESLEPGRSTRVVAPWFRGDRVVADLPVHRAVSYRGLYPGVDLELLGDGRNLTLAFELAAGRSGEVAAWRVEGAETRMSRARDGEIELRLGAEEVFPLRWQRPLAWQVVDGVRVTVPARYELEGRRIRLIAEPVDPQTATRIAANLEHTPYFDSYQAARTSGGIVLAAVSPEGNGRDRLLVARLDSADSDLRSLSFVEGLGSLRSRALAVDASGALYVGGDSTVFGSAMAPRAVRLSRTAPFFARLTPDLVVESIDEIRGSGLSRIDDLVTTPDGIFLTGLATTDVLPTLGDLDFTAILPDRPDTESYVVARWPEKGIALDALVVFRAPKLADGLAAWTGCDGRSLFVGIPVQEAPEVGNKLCLESATRLATKAEPCYSYSTDTYRISRQNISGSYVQYGWGYHALRWKALHANVSYNPAAASPPTGAVFSSDDDDLDAEEADSSVFPSGNPGGHWYDRSASSALELAVASAIVIDRFDSPVYSYLENQGTFGATAGIKEVVFGVLDRGSFLNELSEYCDWLGWAYDPQNYVEEDQVAGDCIFHEGSDFYLSSVLFDWWDGGSINTNTRLSSSQFSSAFGSSFAEPWIADPPESMGWMVDTVVEVADRRSGRVLIEVPGGAVEQRIFRGGKESPMVSKSAPLTAYAVRGADWLH